MTIRRLFPFALLTALALAAPPSASAQDVAGRWVLSVSLSAGSGDATFVFEVDGNELTGTYSGTLGEQPVTGTVDGSSVTFGFTVDQVGEVTFEGTIEGDTMSGDTTYGMLGEGTFSGRKSSG
jgi:polyisoprenoid-binding protein YceI